MFCSKCGNEIDDEAVICLKCGCAVKSQAKPERSWTISFLLCWFFGCLGAHRFYTGYTGIGIAQLLTIGGCGIWTLIDFASLSFNKYKTADNRELSGYNRVLGLLVFTVIIIALIMNGHSFFSNPSEFFK